jgi:hypothetical protein
MQSAGRKLRRDAPHFFKIGAGFVCGKGTTVLCLLAPVRTKKLF